MYRRRSESIRDITNAEASAFLDINYSKQRNITKRRVDAYRKTMQEGLFHLAQIAIAVYPDGTRVLVNGQHTLTAAIAEQQTITACVQTFDVKNSEDVALLYRQFDLGISSRTLRDASAPEFDALGIDWPVDVKEAILASIRILHRLGKLPDAPQPLLPNERIQMIRDFTEDGNWVAQLAEEHFRNWRESSRSGIVVAAQIETRKKSVKHSDVFWRQVRDGVMLLDTDPAYHLRTFLLTTKKRSDMIHEIYSRCIAEWNRYRAGTKHNKKAIYRPGASVPDAI